MAYRFESETTGSSVVILEDWGTAAENEAQCVAEPETFAEIKSEDEFCNDHKPKPRQLESTYG